MAANLLAINVGNTRTRIGTILEGKLTSSSVWPNADMDQLATQIQAAHDTIIQEPGGSDVMLATVSPAFSQKLGLQVVSKLAPRVLTPEENLKVPIGRQLDPETIIGVDRLLNAAAAYDVLKQACVVVDAGTALTVDFVDGAGTFHGGAIAPGARLMLRSLHEHTAQLPDVELARPDEPIGHNTAQAMLCGVYYGIRGMVRCLVEHYAELAGMFPLVVATGGDAELLFHDDELIDRIVPDLTLLGMAVTHREAISVDS